LGEKDLIVRRTPDGLLVANRIRMPDVKHDGGQPQQGGHQPHKLDRELRRTVEAQSVDYLGQQDIEPLGDTDGWAQDRRPRREQIRPEGGYPRTRRATPAV